MHHIFQAFFFPPQDRGVYHVTHVLQARESYSENFMKTDFLPELMQIFFKDVHGGNVKST